MKVNELTAKIHDKYPKVWEKLSRYLNKVRIGYLNIETLNKDINIAYNSMNRAFWYELPFAMLYGLLEDFFMDHGIIITITFDIDEDGYWIEIIKDKFPFYCEPQNIFKVKDDAKQQAILKASKILEGRL